MCDNREGRPEILFLLLPVVFVQNVAGVFGKGCQKRKSSVGNMREHRQSKKFKEGQIGQQSVSQIYMLMHICLVVGLD